MRIALYLCLREITVITFIWEASKLGPNYMIWKSVGLLNTCPSFIAIITEHKSTRFGTHAKTSICLYRSESGPLYRQKRSVNDVARTRTCVGAAF